MSEYQETGRCSICGRQYERWGNNAQPINNGRCCHWCNEHVVIPVRVRAGWVFGDLPRKDEP